MRKILNPQHVKSKINLSRADTLPALIEVKEEVKATSYHKRSYGRDREKVVLFDPNHDFGSKKTISGNRVLKPKSLLMAQLAIDGTRSEYSSYEDGFYAHKAQKKSPTAGYFNE